MKIKKLMLLVIAAMLMTVFPVRVHAEQIYFNNLTWVTNGNDDPWDDVLTFTAPENYRDITSTSYGYKLYLNNYYMVNLTETTEIQIDQSSGTATIFLNQLNEYGEKYSDVFASVHLYDKSTGTNIGYSNEQSHNYPFDTTGSVTGINVVNTSYQTILTFHQYFGADLFTVTHTDDENNLVEPVLTNYSTTLPLSKKVVCGDTISITASHSNEKNTEAKYVYESDTTKFTGLDWHENLVSNKFDDTLSVTMPESYRTYSNSYAYRLVDTIDRTNAYQLNSYSNPIDENGNTTITLKTVTDYGKKLNYKYYLEIVNISNSKVLAYSNIAKKDYSASALETPNNLTASAKYVDFDPVFGASSYTITHQDKDGTDVETAITADTDNANLTTAVKLGDVISVVATNGNLKSDPAVYTIKDILEITELSINKNNSDDPFDDVLTFKVPDGYRQLNNTSYHYELYVSTYSSMWLLNSNALLDESTGIATIYLKNMQIFGNVYSYDFTVQLTINTPSRTVRSDTLHVDYANNIGNPSDIFVNSRGKISYNSAFGARSYEIVHKDSSNNIISTKTRFGYSNVDIGETINQGDTITVQGIDQSLNRSTVALYTVPDIHKINDFTWNTNGTDNDIMDDTISFTANKNFEKLVEDTSSPEGYYYALQYADGQSEKLYTNTQCQIDPSTRKVTVWLAKTSFYASTKNIKAKIVLCDGDGVGTSNAVLATSDEIDKDFSTVALLPPTDLVVTSKSVDFTKSFGATKYTVYHYGNDGSTLVESTPIEVTNNHARLGESASVGDVIKVVASNDSGSSEPKSYTVTNTKLTISNVSLDTNGTANRYDDRIKFTAPEQYRTLGSRLTYYYELEFYGGPDKNTFQSGHFISYVLPATIDSSGVITVDMTSVPAFYNHSDLIYRIKLISDVGGYDEIATSEKMEYSYPVNDLSAPTKISQSGTGVSFTSVYGANSYIVNHYDSKGNLVDGPLTVDGSVPNDSYSCTFTSLNDFDVVTVQAVRKVEGQSDLLSTIGTFTNSGTVTAAKISSIKITGVNANIKTGNKPIYTGKIELTGDNISQSVTDSFVLQEYWREKNQMYIINQSDETAEYQIRYNANYQAVFAPKTQYTYCFMIRYESPAGIDIQMSKDTPVTLVDVNGNTISNISSSYSYENGSIALYQYDFIENKESDPLPEPVTGTAEKNLVVSNNATGTAASSVEKSISEQPTELNFSSSVQDQIGYVINKEDASKSKVLKNLTSQVAIKEVTTDSNNKISKVTLDMDMQLNYVGLKSGESLPTESLHETGANPGEVTIKVALPSDFNANDGDKVIVEHTLSDGSVEDYEGTIILDASNNVKYLTFVNPSGFSDFSVLSASSGTSVTGVSLNKTSTTIIKGSKEQLTATVLPDTATDKTVSWSTSDEKVASVSKDGEITANAVGTATISVKTTDGNKIATCEVSVTDSAVAVTGISLNKTSTQLIVNGKDVLTASIEPKNATNKEFTWSTTDEKVVVVDTNGNLTAIGAGNAKVKATSTDGNYVAECNVTVTATSIAVTGVTLDQTSISLAQGSKKQLTATIAPSDASNKNLRWSSDNTAVATVDIYGEVTAVGEGTATITVTTVDGGKTASCTIQSSKRSVESVSVTSEKQTLNVTESTKVVATITPSDATDKTVTWTSSDSTIATVDSDGNVKALKTGSTTITATTTDGNKTGSVVIKVENATIAVTGITLNNTSLSLVKGNTSILTAEISPSNATNKTVTWTSSSTAVATVSGGTVTAVSAGTATITVTSNNGKSATCTVTVSDPVIAVTGISLNKSSTTLNVNGTETLGATIAPSNATDQSVSWGSSNTAVATVSGGKVTAVSAGTATITAISNNGKTATCTVTVIQPVTGVRIGAGVDNLEVGTTDRFLAYVLPENASNTKITWKSSDEAIATIDNSGNITGHKAGKVTLTVTSVDGGFTDSYELTVINPVIAVTGISLNKSSTTLNVNGTETLGATIAPSNATDQSVSWGSSNTAVATVSGGKVIAVSAGTATITATSNNGKTATCTVTVVQPVTGVEIGLGVSQATVGEADVRFGGHVLPENATNQGIIWSSSDESIATIDNQGHVTTYKAGVVTFTVKSVEGSFTDSAEMKVINTMSRLESFVYTLYRTTLDREPDANGMNYWVGQLKSGARTGSDVVSNFVFSSEFIDRNFCNEHYVRHLYMAIFSREADTGGLNYWIGQLSSGSARESVLNGFLDSDEFRDTCSNAGIKVGTGMEVPAHGTIQTWPCSEDNRLDSGIGSFVLRMYTKCLSRDAEKEGAAYWAKQLNNRAMSGTQLANYFFTSAEFQEHNYSNSDYATRLYRTFFNREGDADGMSYWTRMMSSGMSRGEVLLGFADSAEWREICANYGIPR